MSVLRAQTGSDPPLCFLCLAEYLAGDRYAIKGFEWTNEPTPWETLKFKLPLPGNLYHIKHQLGSGWRRGRRLTFMTFYRREGGVSSSSALSSTVLAPQRHLLLELLSSCSRLNYVASFPSCKKPLNTAISSQESHGRIFVMASQNFRIGKSHM